MMLRTHAWMSCFLILTTLPLSGCSTFWPLGDASRDPASQNDPDSIQAQREKRRLRLQAAEANRDIILGMHMRDVRSAWGDPTEVQTAGEQIEGNQKWIYEEGLSNRWHVSSARVIYFENGQVVGWESRRAN